MEVSSYAAAPVVALFTLCSAVVVTLWLPKALHHVCTAVAILALSTLVALVGQHIFNSWAEMAISADLPPPISFVSSKIRPIASANVLSTTDIICVSLLFYAAYGVAVVVRRLMDTIRILKVSRRRLIYFSVGGASGGAK